MSYTALYRKLRPHTFDNVIGQDHIVRTLINQVNSNRISHAYLFCGTRGTGKTSTAKILSKVINCENLDGANPCNICASCVSISAGRSMNVIEIDAASNNGVDNIRDIREEVKYPPTSGKYKVYIIDEVHMLSTGAFNALLKTLEEPPEHVIFILATTDPQKIPATILSRCQRFDFRRISVVAMVDTLEKYMAEENVVVDKNALSYIAKISDGAMRDALSTLDQAIAFYYGENITLEKVLDITGSVDSSVFFKLTEALSKKDTTNCLNIIEEIVSSGRDINQFSTEFVAHLRNLLVAITAPKSEMALDFSEENKEAFLKQGKENSGKMIIEYINVFSELQSRLKYASNERVLLEVTCIRLCNPEDKMEKTEHKGNDHEDSLTKRLDMLEVALSKGVKLEPEKDKEIKKPTKQKAVPADIKAVNSTWPKFISSFSEPERNFLQTTKAGYLEDSWLYIVCDSMGFVSILKNKEELIKQKLSDFYEKSFEINIVHKDLYNQNHRSLYGIDDDFKYEYLIESVTDKINFDINLV